jgi:hypothetical protein
MTDRLLFCDCGHGLTLHGPDGCRARRCSCWITRGHAIVKAIQEIERGTATVDDDPLPLEIVSAG